jgi:threonine dehydrogenase-like Zn-dependent dehydrogenase
MHGFAAVYSNAHTPLDTRSYPVLAPGAGEARVRLEQSGICGTDLHILHGRLAIPGPLILGHEFIGRLDALGSTPACDGLGHPLALNDAVIACVAVPCGGCASCAREETASCLNFGVTYFKDPAVAPHFHGGFAEYLFSPLQNLIKIPAGISIDAVAAFPCAGPTIIRACAYGGGVEAGELVVVQGTGPVGLFAIAWAVAAGCTVVAIGSGASPRRTHLAEAFGARCVLDYRAQSAEERTTLVKELASELGRADGADVVIEASGAPTAIPEGLGMLRTRGRYFIPGQYSSSGAVTIAPELITFRALRLIGSGQYTLDDVAAYLDFLHTHPAVQAQFAASITHRFTLDRAAEAIATVDVGDVGKAVFVRR